MFFHSKNLKTGHSCLKNQQEPFRVVAEISATHQFRQYPECIIGK